MGIDWYHLTKAVLGVLDLFCLISFFGSCMLSNTHKHKTNLILIYLAATTLFTALFFGLKHA